MAKQITISKQDDSKWAETKAMGHMQWSQRLLTRQVPLKYIANVSKNRYEIMDLTTGITICRIIKLLKPNFCGGL